jgi:hypothetical protein
VLQLGGKHSSPGTFGRITIEQALADARNLRREAECLDADGAPRPPAARAYPWLEPLMLTNGRRWGCCASCTKSTSRHVRAAHQPTFTLEAARLLAALPKGTSLHGGVVQAPTRFAWRRAGFLSALAPDQRAVDTLMAQLDGAVPLLAAPLVHLRPGADDAHDHQVATVRAYVALATLLDQQRATNPAFRQYFSNFERVLQDDGWQPQAGVPILDNGVVAHLLEEAAGRDPRSVPEEAGPDTAEATQTQHAPSPLQPVRACLGQGAGPACVGRAPALRHQRLPAPNATTSVAPA